MESHKRQTGQSVYRGTPSFSFSASNSLWSKNVILNHQLTPHTKTNSTWIKDLNISHDTIEVPEEKIDRKISEIPCSSIFTDMYPRARDIKEKINKWDFIKIKSFFMA